MVSRILVTTALEETWPTDGSPVLFLGEWCRLYTRKHAWLKQNAEVAPYHWSDRKKLHNDYLYLKLLYEELLSELAVKLNELHGVNYSIRYWRILVGPWLGYFIQILFDRWEMIQSVMRQNCISGVKTFHHDVNRFIPNDMTEFGLLYVNDAWNEYIYANILGWMKFPVERIQNPSNASFDQPVMKRVGLISGLKLTLNKLANSIFGILSRKEEYFFITTYLRRSHNIQLQILLGQVPKLWQTSSVPKISTFSGARQWCMKGQGKSDNFTEFVRTMIPRQIPSAYLEGYMASKKFVGSLPWPEKPKAIFTSNSYSSDDLFKLWAAGKVEQGSPLVVGQHGGNFGMALWGYTEDHQLDISDCFVSWGWTLPGRKNISPVGILSGFGKRINPNKSGMALLVEMTLPRYSYHMYSVPVAAEQWISYFEDQCRFVQALPEILRKQVLVRLHAQDYELGQKLRWLDRFPAVKLEGSAHSMGALMKKSRLYISSYNSTTYLESMSLNFPTIIFWNPEHWELCDGALPYFEKLKSVGIFHDTPESAAQQMMRVWDDVSRWWDGELLQTIRKEFCERYANNPPRPLLTLKRLFREVAASKVHADSGGSQTY